eukprot:TsM_000581100 transcript=TsM_000581100 gene=TsM_000581100
MHTKGSTFSEQEATLFLKYNEALHSIGRRLHHRYHRGHWNGWMRRLAYFLLFYMVLATFFFGYIYTLMYFDIDRDRPSLTGPSSALGFNPGLSIVPRPDLYSSLIRTTSRSIE